LTFQKVKFGLWGFSKFVIWPKDSYQYTGGVWIEECRKREQAGDNPFLAVGYEYEYV
jgi:hypothetical protein